MIAVALVIFPDGANRVRVRQRRGVVSGDRFGIFLGKIESLGDPAKDGVEGLLLETVQPGCGPFIKRTFDVIQPFQQRTAIFQSGSRHIQRHVRLERSSRPWGERRVGCSERA